MSAYNIPDPRATTRRADAVVADFGHGCLRRLAFGGSRWGVGFVWIFGLSAEEEKAAEEHESRTGEFYSESLKVKVGKDACGEQRVSGKLKLKLKL